MIKKICTLSLILAFTLVAQLGVAHLSDDNGGLVEFDPESAPNFFLEDANDDFHFSLETNRPDLKPCDGIITSDYGWRRISRKHARMHLGVDIAAPYGSSVMASADGRVVFAGRKGGYGLAIVIDHGGELTTLYGHNSQLFVKEGELVKRGQEISLVGSTGHSTGPHVHYEVRVDGNPINPSRFL